MVADYRSPNMTRIERCALSCVNNLESHTSDYAVTSYVSIIPDPAVAVDNTVCSDRHMVAYDGAVFYDGRFVDSTIASYYGRCVRLFVKIGYIVKPSMRFVEILFRTIRYSKGETIFVSRYRFIMIF